jgi:hypothetical protein
MPIVQEVIAMSTVISALGRKENSAMANVTAIISTIL